jgi:hypothetical protein
VRRRAGAVASYVAPHEGGARRGMKTRESEDIMETSGIKKLGKTMGWGLAVGCLALNLAACNTTKATLDTTGKFTMSTSPDDSLLTEDGLIRAQYKVDVYTTVAFDNLEQDIARGQGEYVTSLGRLLEVPADRHPQWTAADEDRTPEKLARGARSLSLP